MQPFWRRQSLQALLARPGAIFAVALLLLLLGVLVGWGWRSRFTVSALVEQATHPNVIFTPSSTHIARPVKNDGTNNQISTNFDQKVAQVAAQNSAMGPVLKEPDHTLITPTLGIDPRMLALHFDTGAHLQIPKIGVDAPIETVGVNSTGHMDVPGLHGQDGVGWFFNGPRPGDTGSAIIDGFAIHPNGTPAIFSRLAALHVGDVVLVVNSNAVVQHFRVLSMQSYQPGAVPNFNIFRDQSGPYLNLVTCNDPTGLQTQAIILVHTILT
ncbi:hypothetical protein KDA_18480 [Dictyobacter alpinus]|uniref:Class F sortase n=1 Tax=Dictyobacter alpinus TaxID=2014873 RepID=A0A402B4T1_9CHLR|nr:class F sortase [Dictyobacter alpinus]GCE26364.1 hypothetical protein KDA_18480 [Dictyobacter alpinus]